MRAALGFALLACVTALPADSNANPNINAQKTSAANMPNPQQNLTPSPMFNPLQPLNYTASPQFANPFTHPAGALPGSSTAWQWNYPSAGQAAAPSAFSGQSIPTLQPIQIPPSMAGAASGTFPSSIQNVRAAASSTAMAGVAPPVFSREAVPGFRPEIGYVPLQGAPLGTTNPMFSAFASPQTAQAPPMSSPQSSKQYLFVYPKFIIEEQSSSQTAADVKSPHRCAACKEQFVHGDFAFFLRKVFGPLTGLYHVSCAFSKLPLANNELFCNVALLINANINCTRLAKAICPKALEIDKLWTTFFQAPYQPPACLVLFLGDSILPDERMHRHVQQTILPDPPITFQAELSKNSDTVIGLLEKGLELYQDRLEKALAEGHIEIPPCLSASSNGSYSTLPSYSRSGSQEHLPPLVFNTMAFKKLTPTVMSAIVANAANMYPSIVKPGINWPSMLISHMGPPLLNKIFEILKSKAMAQQPSAASRPAPPALPAEGFAQPALQNLTISHLPQQLQSTSAGQWFQNIYSPRVTPPVPASSQLLQSYSVVLNIGFVPDWKMQANLLISQIPVLRALLMLYHEILRDSSAPSCMSPPFDSYTAWQPVLLLLTPTAPLRSQDLSYYNQILNLQAKLAKGSPISRQEATNIAVYLLGGGFTTAPLSLYTLICNVCNVSAPFLKAMEQKAPADKNSHSLLSGEDKTLFTQEIAADRQRVREQAKTALPEMVLTSIWTALTSWVQMEITTLANAKIKNLKLKDYYCTKPLSGQSADTSAFSGTEDRNALDSLSDDERRIEETELQIIFKEPLYNEIENALYIAFDRHESREYESMRARVDMLKAQQRPTPAEFDEIKRFPHIFNRNLKPSVQYRLLQEIANKLKKKMLVLEPTTTCFSAVVGSLPGFSNRQMAEITRAGDALISALTRNTVWRLAEYIYDPEKKGLVKAGSAGSAGTAVAKQAEEEQKSYQRSAGAKRKASGDASAIPPHKKFKSQEETAEARNNPAAVPQTDESTEEPSKPFLFAEDIQLAAARQLAPDALNNLLQLLETPGEVVIAAGDNTENDIYQACDCATQVLAHHLGRDSNTSKAVAPVMTLLIGLTFKEDSTKFVKVSQYKNKMAADVITLEDSPLSSETSSVRRAAANPTKVTHISTESDDEIIILDDSPLQDTSEALETANPDERQESTAKAPKEPKLAVEILSNISHQRRDSLRLQCPVETASLLTTIYCSIRSLLGRAQRVDGRPASPLDIASVTAEGKAYVDRAYAVAYACLIAHKWARMASDTENSAERTMALLVCRACAVLVRPYSFIVYFPPVVAEALYIIQGETIPSESSKTPLEEEATTHQLLTTS